MFLLLILTILFLLLILTILLYNEWYQQRLLPQRPILSKNNNPIPSIIYKTGPKQYKDLDIELKKNFNKIEKDNPGYKIKYYDDNRCRNFIKKHLSSKVLKAFDNLIPGAYKADLFRYCILYVKGGIYSDLSQKYLVPLDKIIDRYYDRLVVVKDEFHFRCFENGIQISFMAAVPRLSVFKNAIYAIVDNVKHKNYGRSWLDVTGPNLFRKCLNDSNNNNNIKYRLELEQSNGVLRDIKSQKPFIYTKMKNHNTMINKNKSTDYAVLWRHGKIFK